MLLMYGITMAIHRHCEMKANYCTPLIKEHLMFIGYRYDTICWASTYQKHMDYRWNPCQGCTEKVKYVKVQYKLIKYITA